MIITSPFQNCEESQASDDFSGESKDTAREQDLQPGKHQAHTVSEGPLTSVIL